MSEYFHQDAFAKRMLAPNLHFSWIQVTKSDSDHLPVLAKAISTCLPHEPDSVCLAYRVQAWVVQGVTLRDRRTRLKQRTERVDVDFEISTFLKQKGIVIVFFLADIALGFWYQVPRLVLIVARVTITGD